MTHPGRAEPVREEHDRYVTDQRRGRTTALDYVVLVVLIAVTDILAITIAAATGQAWLWLPTQLVLLVAAIVAYRSISRRRRHQ